MPSFMKDEMKKKDEEKLEEMKREIDEAVSQGTGDRKEEEPSGEAGDIPTEEQQGTEETPHQEEAPPEDETELLKKQVEKLTSDLQEAGGDLKRLRADFENFRRRTAKEKEEVADVISQEIIRDMLPLLDNFERAMATDDKGSENFRKGVEMIFTQFVGILKKHGMEPIETKDAKFDPAFHQAVMRVQNPDLEDETIAAELQKGYIVKGRVIRPSMVQVVAN